VELDELVEVTVGQERYRDACAWARRGRASWPDDLGFVPHEMSALWQLDELPLAQRLDLALALYRAMPCYANVMYIKDAHGTLGPAERRTLWEAFRAALASEDDALAGPVAYALLVDFFEDHATAEEAWRETTRQDVAPSERRLSRVLAVAGPVPWPVKAPLLESLVRSLEWHRGVLRALESSAFTVCGEIDVPAARNWLDKLRLPPAELEPLRRRLRSAGPSA
jgi:hypothetical protein